MPDPATKSRFTIKELTILFIYKIIRCLKTVFSVFPIQNNRIIFQSFGHAVGYSCNPKYICEYLKLNYPDQFEIIWAFAHPEKFNDIDGIISVKHKSLKWLYYLYTSKVIVLNEGPSAFVAKRKGQYLIQTWHGGGAYKRVGFARENITPLWKWIYETAGKDIDLFLSSSRVAGRTSAYETYHYTGELLNCGSPRNDILLNCVARDEAAKKVKEQLGISNQYVVLYAPTFRNSNENLRELFSFSELSQALKKKVKKDITFLIRAHRYHDRNYQPDISTIDVTDYPDMQELLCASDMLITDYSSCMWDFALLKRPCLLFVPDLGHYDANRGFFTPISDWPGFICETAEELYYKASVYNETLYEKKAETHLQLLGSYEEGTASRQVCDRILKVTEQKNGR